VGFETYTLFREPGSRAVSRDSKVGFCITSEVPVHGIRATASAAQSTGLVSYTDDTRGCGAHQPTLTRVVESLNPRTGDSYGPALGGQNVDITDAANGQYVLVIRVNPAGRLIESNYKNDFASLRISIHRSKIGAKPSVRVLRRCPGARACNL
jgi:Lysyl oxidase